MLGYKEQMVLSMERASSPWSASAPWRGRALHGEDHLFFCTCSTTRSVVLITMDVLITVAKLLRNPLSNTSHLYQPKMAAKYKTFCGSQGLLIINFFIL